MSWETSQDSGQAPTVVCDRCGLEMIPADAAVSPEGVVVHRDGCPKKRGTARPFPVSHDEEAA